MGDTILPTMDTMDTLMPTIMDTSMARGPLMPNLRLLLMLVSIMVTMDMDTILLTMDTMDTHMPTITDISMARGLLMPNLLLMLPMDTMVTHTTMDMPTMDIMDTLMLTMDTMDIIINLFCLFV